MSNLEFAVLTCKTLLVIDQNISSTITTSLTTIPFKWEPGHFSRMLTFHLQTVGSSQTANANPVLGFKPIAKLPPETAIIVTISGTTTQNDVNLVDSRLVYTKNR